MPPSVSTPTMLAPTPDMAESRIRLPFKVPFKSRITELEFVELTLES